jgi:hypothetical protein
MSSHSIGRGHEKTIARIVRKFDADQSGVMGVAEKFPDFMPVHVRFVPLVEWAHSRGARALEFCLIARGE